MTPGTDCGEGPAGLGGAPGLAALPAGELGELAADEIGEVGAAEAPELVDWHAAIETDPRIAETTSAIWELRIMQVTTTSCPEG